MIPFDRVQDIAIEQRLLARLFGTAKVKIETGGAAKDEGNLDMIALADAQALRDQVRHGPAAAAAAEAGPRRRSRCCSRWTCRGCCSPACSASR